MPSDTFPTGLVVFFRLMGTDGKLARSVIPKGRTVRMNSMIAHEDDYVVTDAEGEFLGCYPRDFVSAILPLETTGPADADNTPQPARH